MLQIRSIPSFTPAVKTAQHIDILLVLLVTINLSWQFKPKQVIASLVFFIKQTHTYIQTTERTNIHNLICSFVKQDGRRKAYVEEEVKRQHRNEERRSELGQ